MEFVHIDHFEDASLIDYVDAVAKFRHDVQVMRGEQYEIPLLAVVFEIILYLVRRIGIESYHRLVENEYFGIVDQRSHKRNFLFHTVRVGRDLIIDGIPERKQFLEFIHSL